MALRTPDLGDCALPLPDRRCDHVGGLCEEMHAGFAEIHAAHSELLLKLFFGMVASNATLVGLVLAAVRMS